MISVTRWKFLAIFPLVIPLCLTHLTDLDRTTDNGYNAFWFAASHAALRACRLREVGLER